MPRPRCCRRITGSPACAAFGPVEAVPGEGPHLVLTPDEFEALRLADHEGLYHEEAAASMGVSRQTFGRIVQSARSKVAEALVTGATLRIAAQHPGAGCGARACPRCAARNTEKACPRGCPRQGEE